MPHASIPGVRRLRLKRVCSERSFGRKGGRWRAQGIAWALALSLQLNIQESGEDRKQHTDQQQPGHLGGEISFQQEKH